MIFDCIRNRLRSWNLIMEKDKKKLSEKEKRRLKFIKEVKNQRNIKKHNFNFPRSRNIEFKDRK
jgi:DNA-directed RNA polymerase subunit E'/Rpb7